MQSHRLKVPRTAHYYTLGETGKHVKRFWIVCHGYGQAAARFIHSFDELVDGETFILAPEGLSRFYWGGFTGEVVASWMTKGDRLDEIEDYTDMIRSLYDLYKPLLSENVEVTLLGFSQGVATQWRWMLKAQPEIKNIVNWAGLFPDDLDYSLHQEYLKDKQLHFAYGTEDPFLKTKHIEWMEKEVEKIGLSSESHTFEGKHVMDRAALLKLFNQLKNE